ncbi:MAG TPA: tetratricopeptide repeat protein [Candidatus Eisenbacteria bacterium]
MSFVERIKSLPILKRWIARPKRESATTSEEGGLEETLDRADLLLVLGRDVEAQAALEPALRLARGARGPLGLRLRARTRILGAECLAKTGARDAARQSLFAALEELADLGVEARAQRLRERAQADLGLLARADDPNDELVRHGERALAREFASHDRDALLRLAFAARSLGRVLHAQGRWPDAKRLLEQAVRLGRRLDPPASPATTDPASEMQNLFWSRGRAVSSDAALDLGSVAWTLGDRDSAVRWFDQAITALEGADSPLARLVRAKALLMRATYEPDAMTGEGRRTSLLERAVENGLGCGSVQGRVLASQAETALGTLHASRGATSEAASHLRRAHEHLRGIAEPGVGIYATQPLVLLGLVIEDADPDAACDAFRAALGRGREEGDLDSRRLAALAAYHLHRLLIEQGCVEQARGVVDTLEVLLPTLAPDARSMLSGLAARSRGHQCLRDERPDEARTHFERAETVGRASDTPWGCDLARDAAADLGRMALLAGRPEEAEPCFRRALETPRGGRSQAEEKSVRAGITLELVQALLALDRHEEAAAGLQRAFDDGCASGHGRGREVAAIAALLLGDLASESPETRRRWYESAAQLGRLCGRERGREVVADVEARRRTPGD